MKTLEKDRTRRYDTVGALVGDVQRYLRHEPVAAGPPSVWYRTKKFAQRHWALATASAVVAAVVIAGLIVSTTLYLRAAKAQRQEVMARRNEEAARLQGQAVVDFLVHDLLASVHPERAKGAEVTVRYILEAASEGLDSKFAAQPLVEAEIREALGLTYQKMGDYAAAEPHVRRVLDIRREQLGPEHPSTLAALNSLGVLYSQYGRYREGDSLLTQALDLRTRILGPEHRDTLESMADLAWQHICGTRFREGMALAAQAVEVGRRVLGQEDPVVLKAMSSLTLAYAADTQYVRAEEIAGPGYETARRVLGEEHETTLKLLIALSWAYGPQGRTEVSTELAERALETSRRVLGERHVVTLFAMNNLGMAYIRQGRPEAGPVLTQTTELAMDYLGEAHMATVCAHFSLTHVLVGQGRDDERDALLLRLLEVSRRTHGTNHPQTGYITYWLRERLIELGEVGRRQYGSGDYEGVLATFAKSTEMREALFGRSASSEEAYCAMALHHLGRLAEAQKQLELLRRMYEHDEPVYDAAPLYRAEWLLAATGSEARRVWGLIEDGELDEALSAVERLNQIDTGDDTRSVKGRQSLAKALARAYCHQAAFAQVDCRYDMAEQHLEAAVRACPGYAVPLQELAWFRATCPADEIRDGDEAIALATAACELTEWTDIPCIEALAAGCAEARDFASAATWQRQAIDLLPADAHSGQRAVSQRRLGLYLARRPFRSGGTRSLVARWDFDNVVEARVVDASGNGHDGILVGDAAIVDDAERGRVLHLAGAGHVNCGADPAFDLTGPFSLAAWIRTDASDTSDWQVIVTKGRGSWQCRVLRDTGKLRFGAGGLEILEDQRPVDGDRQVNDGRWHHIAGVYDGTRLRLYVDGELDASVAAGGTVVVNDSPITIGSIGEPPPGGPTDWSGWIDDVCLYDYGLSVAEIRTLFFDRGVGDQGGQTRTGGDEEGAG